MRRVWQVQAGNAGRQDVYQRIALTFAVAMIGTDALGRSRAGSLDEMQLLSLLESAR